MIVAVLSCVPYLVFKLAWLSGATIGITSAEGRALMNDPRHVAGNYLTVGMDLLAIGLAVVLGRPISHRLPAWLVLVPAWGATGLLAPIALGLPAGLLIQLISGTDVPAGSGDGLAGWVFAVIYGGFGLLGCCLAVLVLLHAMERWPRIFATGPRPPRWTITAVCAAPLLGYALALLVWAVAGPEAGGPAGFESPAQRTVLVINGLLVAIGYATPLARGFVARHPRRAIVATWVGCSVATLSGPTFAALGHDGVVRVPLLVASMVSAAAGVLYSVALLRATAAPRSNAAPRRGQPSSVSTAP
ncbi:hypothetical protein HNP84_002195 [Thermocatellispora tengchongensis]|uniref:Uncharacterized protein n=1 Tax=Thermocatellispora tengchongensis TaxID=1073253 RepID=A0A840P0H0_9ACTN|nr:hypothetical protein [Thermocatellispora tengchongensis]MBB5132479.1 hypothetical protein [Thermocatellispora tengchongensis]